MEAFQGLVVDQKKEVFEDNLLRHNKVVLDGDEAAVVYSNYHNNS
jgi:hypothetical protein